MQNDPENLSGAKRRATDRRKADAATYDGPERRAAERRTVSDRRGGSRS